MKTLSTLLLGFSLALFSNAGEKEFAPPKKQSVAEHLQNVSVTIRSEGAFSAGEGSGVIFTRKDSKGNLVNFNYVYIILIILINYAETLFLKLHYTNIDIILCE